MKVTLLLRRPQSFSILLLCLIKCVLISLTHASSICPTSSNTTNTTQLCSSALICFSVISVNSLIQFDIQFTQSPEFFWSNPASVTSIAINEEFLASSLYNFTQLNSTQAQVNLQVAGYIPPTATVAVRIDDSSSLTPILAYNTACGPLLNTQSSSLDPSGLARFINISGAIHFFLILIYSLGDFGWGGMVRRSLMLDFILHMSFVNVNMTSDLQLFYSIAGKSYITAALPISINSGNSTAKGQFEQFSYPPQFLANFGGEFFMLLIMIVVGMLVALLASIKWKKTEGFPRYIRYLDKSINFNLIVNMMLGYSFRAFIGLMVNFANLSFGSPLNTFSFLLAIVFLIIYLALAGLIVRCLRQRATVVQRSERIYYGRSTILYQDYSLDTSLQRYFTLLLLLRAFLTAIVLAAIQNSPTAQLILLLLIQSVYCTYTFGLFPLKQNLDHLVESFGELMLAFVTITMFGLGSLTADGASANNTIAWGCIIFTFFYALFLFFVLIYELKVNLTSLFRCIPNPIEEKTKPTIAKQEPVKQDLNESVITYEVREIKLNLKPFFRGPKRRKTTELESEPDEPSEKVIMQEMHIQDNLSDQFSIRGDTSRRSYSELLSQTDKDRSRREQQLRELQQLNQARQILRDFFESELENKANDDVIDEVQDIKEARERERQKALDDIAPGKGSANGKNPIDTTSIRIKSLLENRSDLTTKQLEESNKLTDKVLKRANSHAIRQQQQESRRDQQVQNGMRTISKTPSLSFLSESMKADPADQEKKPAANLMNNSDDTSFIENFLKELSNDNTKQKPRNRRTSAQSDILGAELDAETNRMRVGNDQANKPNNTYKRGKMQTNADLLEYIMKKHGNKVQPKITEEFESETPKNGNQNQQFGANKANSNSLNE